MSKLTKQEIELFDEFKELCDKLSKYTISVSVGNKFKPTGRVILTYKRSGKQTRWAYLYTEDYRINTFYDCNLWGFTIESQVKIVEFLKQKLNEYEK